MYCFHEWISSKLLKYFRQVKIECEKHIEVKHWLCFPISNEACQSTDLLVTEF